MPRTSPWWDRQRHADRRPFLEARGRIKTGIRSRFLGEGFTETECGVLQTSPGNEAHLHAFATELIEPGDARRPLYLHTSPEFSAKKLLAAGETKIFEFARCFRNRERGALHHPEFTLLEWYRAGAPYPALFAECLDILRTAADAAGTTQFVFRGKSSDPFSGLERVTLGEAFGRYAGVDLLSLLDDREGFAAAARAAGIRVADDDVWADIFSRVLVEKVEPNLGLGRPTILYEYPASEAALARRTDKDRRVAERFELYVCGVEIANGFGELTDAGEQRTRFQAEMEEKQRVYGERYPIDEDFLGALAHMQEASGCALGFDRLVMLATGAEHIEQVMWTPVP
jgi:elongation factor P--(R)-beta-lysine ligase